MWFAKCSRGDDQVQEWLLSLQERFELNAKEADGLYKITRTCFAHNFCESEVIRVIYNYMSKLGRELDLHDIEADGVFTYRAGNRRYGKWSWQESASGLLAYLLTTLFFMIDILVPYDKPLNVATHQFCAVVFVLTIWWLLDKCTRARPKTIALFNAVNRFMPMLTIVAYLLFHLCKMLYFDMCRAWEWGMIAVVVAYVVLGILLSFYYLLQFRKVIDLKAV